MNLIIEKQKVLENHRLYGELRTIQDLRLFMQNHVYAVLDFMSLTKRIQNHFAPADEIWTPPKHPDLARFINEVVLGEESDQLPDGRFFSHYEMYLIAMEEVGADTSEVKKFVECLKQGELLKGLNDHCLYKPARNFSAQTYQQVVEWDIHQIVAAFCHGREKIIPLMFMSLAERCGLKKVDCPTFYFYLERHIELDGDEHGPLADKLLSAVVGDDEIKKAQAIHAAQFCLDQRIRFWDEMSELLNEQRSIRSKSL